MNFKVLLLLIVSLVAFVNCYQELQNFENIQSFNSLNHHPLKLPYHRFERQLNVQGGGSPGQGYDISAQGKVKLWESNNGRHQVHGTGSYSQHLGGPYGSSRPNVGAGATYTFRF